MATAKEKVKLEKNNLEKYNTNWFMVAIVTIVATVGGFFVYSSFASNFVYSGPVGNLNTILGGSPSLVDFGSKSYQPGYRINSPNDSVYVQISRLVSGSGKVCIWGIVHSNNSSFRMLRHLSGAGPNPQITKTGLSQTGGGDRSLACMRVNSFSDKVNFDFRTKSNSSDITLTNLSIER